MFPNRQLSELPSRVRPEVSGPGRKNFPSRSLELLGYIEVSADAGPRLLSLHGQAFPKRARFAPDAMFSLNPLGPLG